MLGGDLWAVVGEAGSSKSRFFEVLLGEAKAAKGSYQTLGTVAIAGPPPAGRRQTPQSVAKSASDRGDSALMVQVLTSLGLWDVRQEPLSKLTSSQTVAVEILPCLLADADLILIDGHLDVLDPWVLEPVLEAIFSLASRGAAFLIATNQPSLAQRLGSLIVWRDSEARFAGTAQDLVRAARPVELLIETSDASTVATMVEPFAIEVRPTEGGLIVTAADGQELAARLLTLGYGSVRAVVVRETSFAEALLAVY